MRGKERREDWHEQVWGSVKEATRRERRRIPSASRGFLTWSLFFGQYEAFEVLREGIRNM